MTNFDNHHFVYYDLVDDWMSFSEFPFLIDWKMDDEGNFKTFSWQEIQAEVAVGVQKLAHASHKSICSVNMLDPFSLIVTFYIANSCIPFATTHGKKLAKVQKQGHLPTDATFSAMPGYDRMNFPFVLMEVQSLSEVYVLNTKTWFKQLLIKQVKDHKEDYFGHYFFSYQTKEKAGHQDEVSIFQPNSCRTSRLANLMLVGPPSCTPRCTRSTSMTSRASA